MVPRGYPPPAVTDDQPTAQDAYVSTAPTTSALKGSASRGARRSGGSPGGPGSGAGEEGKKAAKPHPWRDNIEAVAISIVTIVLFKYFVLEAYKIPTGSMQPTLMGNEETGIYDRVIVDKLSYHYRDPERFEIAVFKYPLDSSKNFIKRIVGMPGEWLGLRGGDPWVRKDGEDKAKVLRRSRAIQNVQLRRLETKSEWLPDVPSGSWKIDSRSGGDRIEATGSGSVTFPRTHSVRDDYLDGYPEGMKSKVNDTNKDSNANEVHDLRVAFEVEVDTACEAAIATIHEGKREFRFVLPGPAAGDGGTARIEVRGIEGAAGTWETLRVSDEPFQLRAGRQVDVEVQNLNDLLSLRIEGKDVATLEVPPMNGSGEAKVSLEIRSAAGARASFDGVQVWRDIYYTSNPLRQKVWEWQIPEGHYVVLGDNSQDSSDGRDWRFARFQAIEPGNDGVREIVRGNARETGTQRPDSNPQNVPATGRPHTIFFTDELGERHVLDASQWARLEDEFGTASLVPRDLIRGRAVLVVWPLAPQHDVYRWKWVR